MSISWCLELSVGSLTLVTVNSGLLLLIGMTKDNTWENSDAVGHATVQVKHVHQWDWALVRCQVHVAELDQTVLTYTATRGQQHVISPSML